MLSPADCPSPIKLKTAIRKQKRLKAKTMLKGEYKFGFAVDWMRKDLSICFNEAKKNGANLPVTKIVDKYYEEVQKNGGSRYDTSSLMTLLDG